MIVYMIMLLCYMILYVCFISYIHIQCNSVFFFSLKGVDRKKSFVMVLLWKPPRHDDGTVKLRLQKHQKTGFLIKISFPPKPATPGLKCE